MSNLYNNEVIFNGQTLMSLKEDTVTPDKVLAGETFHDRSGAPQTGSLITHNVYDGLNSTSASDALSANQGRVLNEKYNALGKVQIVTFTPRSGITNDLFIRRYGRVVYVNGYITSNTAFGNDQVVGTIQDGHRPVAPLRIIGGIANAAYSVGDIAYVYIGNNGNISVTAKSGNTYKVCYFTASYIVES